MQATGRLTILAVAVCLLLLAGYAWLGYSLHQQYQAEAALQESLSKNAPVYLLLRRQPADDLEALNRQLTVLQQRSAGQQALFPKETELNMALDSFLAFAGKNQIFITKLDAQPASVQKTKAGTYQIARYAVKAKGSWFRFSTFLRRLAEQDQFVPMGFENLVVSTDPLGDNLSFDLLIYVRPA